MLDLGPGLAGKRANSTVHAYSAMLFTNPWSLATARRPRRPSSRGLPPLNSTHFTDSLSGTRLFSRARNRWLERHPEKPERLRPRCPSSAGAPCPSKTRTPRKPRNVRRRSVPGAADGPRRQPTCRVASPNAAAAAASVSPAAARPGSRSIVSAGRCSGDTEGG